MAVSAASQSVVVNKHPKLTPPPHRRPKVPPARKLFWGWQGAEGRAVTCGLTKRNGFFWYKSKSRIKRFRVPGSFDAAH